MKEHSPEQQIIRAREARSLLDNELFREAITDIEGRLQNLRGSVPISSSEMHTRLILMEQLWLQLKGYFEQLAVTGKFAERFMEQEARKRSLLEQGVLMFQKMGRSGI